MTWRSRSRASLSRMTLLSSSAPSIPTKALSRTATAAARSLSPLPSAHLARSDSRLSAVASARSDAAFDFALSSWVCEALPATRSFFILGTSLSANEAAAAAAVARASAAPRVAVAANRACPSALLATLNSCRAASICAARLSRRTLASAISRSNIRVSSSTSAWPASTIAPTTTREAEILPEAWATTGYGSIDASRRADALTAFSVSSAKKNQPNQPSKRTTQSTPPAAAKRRDRASAS